MADDPYARIAELEAENASLRGQERMPAATLSASDEQQMATAEVLRVIAASPGQDLRATLRDLQIRAMRLLDAAGGGIFRVDGDVLRRVTSHEAGEEDEGWIERPLDRRTISARAVLDRRVQHIHDVTDIAEAGDVLPESQALRARTGARTFLVVPLLKGHVAIGVIFVARQTVRPFTGREITLLEAFADQAVIAIENARLFQQVQESSRQLAEASQHKSQFLANMSHELRTPLNAIIGYSEMLQEEVKDVGDDAFLPDLVRINAAGQHLLGLINDILDLSKIEAGRMDLFLETFEVGQLVRDVAAIVQPLVEKNATRWSCSVPRTWARFRRIRPGFARRCSTCSRTRPGSLTTAPSA